MNYNAETKPEQEPLSSFPSPAIKVLGLGGGGSNAINRMIELGLTGVEYIAANTDAQALNLCLAENKIQLGPNLTRGLGAGGDPAMGEKAAEESHRKIQKALEGADLVFLTAGMGGGTGTGSISVAARISRAVGAVTVGIVTLPFLWEIGKRQKNAREGLAKLHQFTDTLITVPNQKLSMIAPKDLPFEMSFRLADDVLRQGIQGITQLITQPGLINVDFAHVRRMMLNGGGALLAIGYGQGQNRTMQALKQALNHPLLEAVSLKDATGIIANFTGGEDLAFVEVAEALNYLHNHTNPDSDVIPGINTNPDMKDRVEVILVITGLGGQPVDKSVEKTREPAAADSKEAHRINNQNSKDETMMEYASPVSDFDVPAFIRRKTSTA